MLSMNHQNIAIWGGGRIGKLCYFKLKSQYNVECFFDNDLQKVGAEVIGGQSKAL